MNVAGIGIVFTRGRGVDALETAMKEGWIPPSAGGSSRESSTIAAYRIPDDAYACKGAVRRLRRADRFSRIATASAMDAVADSGLDIEAREDSIGLILATAFGPHDTNFRFLDETLEFGETLGSPTIFSNSLHNVAASHVGTMLGVRGPTLTVTTFSFAFHEALVLAEAWLSEGRCSHVLVGTADVCGAVMEYACGEMLNLAADGKIKPFALASSPAAVPGEGSAFFVLTAEDTVPRYCRISVQPDGDSPVGNFPNLTLLDADGTGGDESGYLELVDSDVPVAAYTPLFGSILTGSGIHAVIAALMLRDRVFYKSPVGNNPHHLQTRAAAKQEQLRRIDCIRLVCDGRSRRVSLRT